MPREVWPVIHVSTPAHAVRNALIARTCGCPGVMLISMRGDDDSVDLAACAMKAEVPNLKIGANYLQLSSPEALARSQQQNLDATWTDRQEFARGELSPHARDVMAIVRPGHLFFAAVAFKGQPPDPFPADSARLAASVGMIPTTSGEATGVAPPVEKLQRIRFGLRLSDRLALASGATPENIKEMAPYLTHVLVSTGISGAPDEFEQSKLSALVANAE